MSDSAIENVFLYDKEELIEMGYFDQGEFDEDEVKKKIKVEDDGNPSEAEKNGQF